ncbi:MAG: 4-(cytidine 5'-diphospho)-2-C-methyl-D-erythritol kinase [Planctomycetota bacterium]
MIGHSARTSPPAKLNLFLEIPAKRADGYHEIDTVMTAIDWRDELLVRSIEKPVVRLDADWLPSRASLESELGIDPGRPSLLDLPKPEENLVTRALECFRSEFRIESGFDVRLGKRIPPGAGMGGASSDAAHAISCAAMLHEINDFARLHAVAAEVGSDVPFFLYKNRFCHAGGRGERLTPLESSLVPEFIVIYPAIGLSTARVYQELCVPQTPHFSDNFRNCLVEDDFEGAQGEMRNRLQEPAQQILPRISELIDSLWKSGLQTCQLTGSGSACFGIRSENTDPNVVIEQLRREFSPGVLIRAVRSVPASADVEISADC